MKMGSLNILVEKEELAFSIVSLIGDCGGALGLFIGFNFHMIWDLFSCIQKLSTNCPRNKRKILRQFLIYNCYPCFEPFIQNIFQAIILTIIKIAIDKFWPKFNDTCVHFIANNWNTFVMRYKKGYHIEHSMENILNVKSAICRTYFCLF